MSGEVVDTFDGADDETVPESGIDAKMELDDLERRAREAIDLGHVAIDEENGDALEGIAHTLLAFARKECESR